MSGAQHRKRGRQPHYIRRWTRAGQTGGRDRFDEILETFMREFVAQRMAGGEDTSAETVPIAYQREPTFRVVLPSGQQLGYPHCDADYHHPPAEINWWLPLTAVSDSNSLHTESLPGAGDFAPVSLRYGQVLRFYGNLCRHYTVPNISTATRVSFDTRVLSLAHHHQVIYNICVRSHIPLPNISLAHLHQIAKKIFVSRTGRTDSAEGLSSESDSITRAL